MKQWKLKQLKSSLVAFVLGLALVVGTHADANFVDESQIIEIDQLPKGPSNITEQEFNQILSKISQIYDPLVSGQGGQLVMQGQWKSETLNAGAAQVFGSWRVQITGGLARRPELTKDGFSLIVCHELGYHLGGFPFT